MVLVHAGQIHAVEVLLRSPVVVGKLVACRRSVFLFEFFPVTRRQRGTVQTWPTIRFSNISVSVRQNSLKTTELRF